MKTRRRQIAFLLATSTLASCSLRLQVELFNDAGETVMVHSEGKHLAIVAGQSSQFGYPGEDEKWTLRVSTTACDYTYAVPRTLEHYPWSAGSAGTLKAQIEQDMSVYLLPPTASAVTPISGVGALQQDGFPLHPATTVCH